MTRIVLLPGMGADARLHAPLVTRDPRVVALDWLPHHGAQGLADYAQRFVTAGLVRAGDVVGGSSLGGMIAGEIARLLPVRALVLIGSCRHPRAVNPLALALSPLAKHFPFAVVSRALAALPLPGRFAMLVRMAADCDQDFLRWACAAIPRWNGVETHTIPVQHIHGAWDPLILPRGQAIDELIPRAPHPIAWTHPDAVAKFLLTRIGDD